MDGRKTEHRSAVRMKRESPASIGGRSSNERYMGLTTEAGADYEHTYRSFFKDAEAEDSIGNIVWNIFASMLVNRGTSKLKFKVGEFL